MPTDWGLSTCVMGVINLTPDSFSDGGTYQAIDQAVHIADLYLTQGADVLDLGAQSTRPGALEVGPEQEKRRLIPALKAIREKHQEAIISIDTFHSSVAKEALENGADWINDVSGGRQDPHILNLVAETNCQYILTHSRGNSISMDQLNQYNNVTIDVKYELLKSTDKALNKGIKVDQIIWDPGLGFAKDTNQNISLLRNLNLLREEGFPLLIGPSRKRFIGEILNEPDYPERIWGLSAIACLCSQLNVEMIRVHDIGPIVKTLKMAKRLWN